MKDVTERLEERAETFEALVTEQKYARFGPKACKETATTLRDALTEIQKLRSMLQWCSQQIWDGGLYIDGGDFQGAMVKRGLWVEVPATPEVAGEWGVDKMHVVAWSELAK